MKYIELLFSPATGEIESAFYLISVFCQRWSLPKEFGMATDSDQIYNVSINPDEKEIVLDVTLHASFVIAFQQVWFIFRWYGQIIDEQIGNLFKRFDLFRK